MTVSEDIASAIANAEKTKRTRIAAEASERARIEREAKWQVEADRTEQYENRDRERGEIEAAQRAERERRLQEAARLTARAAQRRRAELAADAADWRTILDATFGGAGQVEALSEALSDKLRSHLFRLVAEDGLKRAQEAAEQHEIAVRREGQVLGQGWT